MGKEKSISAGSLVYELFRPAAYKRNQGRTVRMVTAGTLAVVVGLAAWRVRDTLAGGGLDRYSWPISLALLALGWWLSYRVVNYPRFADFLIAVEAEMSKVSWPTRTELFRSSIVVILLIFSMAGVLFAFDMFWQYTFRLLGVILS